jgi:hypothetical protein
MGSLTAPPGTSVSPAADAAQALFMEARRRRRRRWLARTAAVLVVAAVVAVCAVIWLPGASDQAARRTGAVGGLVGRSSGPSWRATVVFRVATAGVPEAYGTWNIRSSGHNRSLSFSEATLAAGPDPERKEWGTERIVDGQIYALFRPHGRLEWFHEPIQPYIRVEIIDPRKLLRTLAPFARFQAMGYQVIGGVRLKVLRATDPHRLTHHALLPVTWTSGQPVGSLELWVDGHGVVHRMAFTFRARGRILLSTPVSEKALAAYGRAELALTSVQSHYVQPGSRIPKRQLRTAMRRYNQALRQAFPVRHGYEATSTTVIFTAIGQPQLVTAPPKAVSAH